MQEAADGGLGKLAFHGPFGLGIQAGQGSLDVMAGRARGIGIRAVDGKRRPLFNRAAYIIDAARDPRGCHVSPLSPGQQWRSWLGSAKQAAGYATCHKQAPCPRTLSTPSPGAPAATRAPTTESPRTGSERSVP